MAAALRSPPHGGGVFLLARELGRDWREVLDFSASINPLGPPVEVMAALRERLPEIRHYPELDAHSFVAAVATHHRLDPGAILPAAGSTELFYLLPRVLRPRRALVVTPAFSEYRRGLELAGVSCASFPLAAAEGFPLPTERLLGSLPPEIDLVLLANPANPTGQALPASALASLAAGLRGRAWLAVDEAFADFSPDCSLLPRLREHDNLLVFRSLTKYYALPGLRLGYLAGPPGLIDRCRAAQVPWPLSAPAAVAGEVCLRQEAYRQQTAATIPVWRRQLATGLEELGWFVHPSRANYLLARFPGSAKEALKLGEKLRQQALLIRHCGDFSPLDHRYCRLAVRTPAENGRLLAALQAEAPDR